MQFLGPILAFAATSLLIVLLRPVAISIGLVDVPCSRKTHSGAIPLIGGMAIFVGASLALLAQANVVEVNTAPLPALFISVLIVVFIGAWDDYADLPFGVRLFTQVIAALVMIYGGGVVLSDLGNVSLWGSVFYLGILSVPFTVFACVGVINAMNMCDGLDGLSGSIALIALLGLGIANALWGTTGNQHLIVALAACVIGFLGFNLRTIWRSRAWVFLGDAGSMLLGMTLCWLTVSMSQGEDRVFSPAAALWFLMMPLYDSVSMILRRVLRKRSPFEADREHLHHIFLLAGFSVSESVTLMCGLAVSGVVIGLGGTWLQVPDLMMAALFLVGGGLYYHVIRRAWAVMRFLRRSICRRKSGEDSRVAMDPTYAGRERRSAKDSRLSNSRRTGDS